MAKKELQIFSMSFLDLLSGALAAVIILFIIVPKMDIKSKEALKSMKELQEKFDDLNKKIKDIDGKVDAQLYQEIIKQVNEVQQSLKEARNQVEDLVQKVESLTKQVEDLKKYKEWMDNCGLNLNSNCPPKSSSTTKGFDYKGKKIIFIVDVSGSMIYNDLKEDRLTPLKAGLRMLLAMMDEEYYVDVIQFPYQGECNFKAHFSQLKELNESNKESLSNYIRQLKADGPTPTGIALNYALTNYPDLTDIVLITDGEPTCDGNKSVTTNQNVLQQLSDKILSEVRNANTGQVRINAIGVGGDFFDDPNHIKVQFLQKLTSENGSGFFIKFD
jgi:ribosomal protein RSM22 (predicted rRNA methylase)